MFSFRKPKQNPTRIFVALQARLQPMDRGQVEDIVVDRMAKRGHKIEVSGGGTSLSEENEPQQADIDIDVDNLTDSLVSDLTAILVELIAPKGSSLRVGSGAQPVAIGNKEGLALYLNGIDLPQEVYATSDFDHVWEECRELLEGCGRVYSYWQGPRETALYMYGDSFEAMRARIKPFVDTYPLCQKSRMVQIA